MVKIGFIVEGASEKTILESQAFQEYLRNSGVQYIPDVIDIEGGGKLLPEHREESVKILRDKGATHIVILVDKEDAPCFSSVRDRIKPEKGETVIIANRAIEAWYLADSSMLSGLFKRTYYFEYPENTNNMPFDVIKAEMLAHSLNGPGLSKVKFARRIIKSGFSIANAAKHENCPSAKYFLAKLVEIAKQ